MKGIRALLLTVGLAAALVAVAAGLWWQSGWIVRAYWRNQLANTSDDRASAILDQIGDLGLTGIPVLVDSLDSPRKAVAEASSDKLWSEILCWDRLPSAEASLRLATLAECLAERVEQFRPSAQADAYSLAAQILLRRLDETAIARRQVTANCERVLAATEQAHAEVKKVVVAPLPFAPAKTTTLNTISKPTGQASQPSATDSPASTATEDSLVSDSPDAHIVINRPSHLAGESPADPAEAQSNQTDSSREPAMLGHKGKVREISKPTETAENEPRLLAVDTSLDVVDVMRNLQSSDPATVATAQTELVRRGFSHVQLELARRMFDPNPDVRRQLIRVLPEMRSIDATPWLLQLCRDENPDVRRSAFTLMATTTDPRLVELLIQLARQDTDPGIQQQADRLATARNDALRSGPKKRR